MSSVLQTYIDAALLWFNTGAPHFFEALDLPEELNPTTVPDSALPFRASDSHPKPQEPFRMSFLWGCTAQGLPGNQHFTLDIAKDSHTPDIQTSDAQSADVHTLDIQTPDIQTQDSFTQDSSDSTSSNSDSHINEVIDAPIEIAEDIEDAKLDILPDTAMDAAPDSSLDIELDTVPTQPNCSLQASLPKTCDITSLSAGQFANCTTQKKGSVACWGNLPLISTKNPSLFNTALPKAISGLNNITATALSTSHLCALSTAGAVWCVGDNYLGQLGTGPIKSSLVPVQTNTPPNIVKVSTGAHHTCALQSSGEVYCWGYNNFSQLGIPDMSVVALPQKVSIPFPVDSVDAGARFTIFSKGGTAFASGDNSAGQLGLQDAVGLPDPVTQTTPAPTNTKGIDYFAAGSNFTLMHYKTCAVAAMGGNEVGQLAQGSLNKKLIAEPTAVKSLTDIASIFAGGRTGCALTTQGALYCWGDNENGQTGTGLSNKIITTPTLTKGLTSPVVLVAIGEYHICVVDTSCKVYCAGLNNHNQLGDFTAPQSNSFIPVQGF